MCWKEVREIVGFRAEDIAVDLEGLLVASDEDRHNGTVDCARGVMSLNTSIQATKERSYEPHITAGLWREREREKKLNNFAEEEQSVRLIVSTGMRRLQSGLGTVFISSSSLSISSFTESRAEQPRASKLGLFDISVGVFFFFFPFLQLCRYLLGCGVRPESLGLRQHNQFSVGPVPRTLPPSCLTGPHLKLFAG